MLNIKDYITDKFTLGVSQEAETRIRTKFDYGVRQRRGKKGYVQYETRLILTRYNLNKFQDFYDDLDYGIDTFEVQQEIHGKLGQHQIRFISPYEVTALGANRYEVISQIEVIVFGTEVNGCPLYPSNSLYSDNILYPC